MILTIISTLLGILSSTIPSLIQYFSRKKELEYEITIATLKVEAAKNGLDLSREIADIKAMVDEGNNIRVTDAELDGGSFVNSLRASVRPVLTYALFGLFIGIKFFVAAIILMSADLTIQNLKLAFDAILDENTMAITSTVVGYYFGARTLEKFQSTPVVKVTPQSKLIAVINKK